MLLTTRREAIAAGQNTYHTGQPCKNGHTTYRYSQSGSCSGCVHKKENGFVRDSGTIDRAKFLQESVEVMIFVPFEDVELMREAVQQLNDLRWPGLTTVLVPLKERDAVQRKFKVRAHLQDSQIILKIAATFCKRFTPDFSAVHRRIAAATDPVFPPIIPRA